MRRAAGIAVLKNPFAGRYEADIQWFMEDLKPLGLEMATGLIALLGGANQIEGYAKGAMEVGLNDAPKADEIAAVLVMSSGARIHDRAGGLAARDIVGKDGLR